MLLNVSKMNGCGNDMLMIDNREGNIFLTKDQIRKICDRHFGIGADGLILLESSDTSDCFMNYYNSDGTAVETCGNGIRCTADFYYFLTKTSSDILHIDTRAGVKEIQRVGEHEYAVDMGIPSFESTDFPSDELEFYGMKFSCVSMGNPHTVTFVDDAAGVELENIGPKIETDSCFPNLVNVSFAKIVDTQYVKVRVWERGCGATLACGTAACAVFAIGRKQGILDNSVVIELPGGKLRISERGDGHIIMAGPAETVFSAEIEVE